MQLWLPLSGTLELSTDEPIIIYDIIVDCGSRYSVVAKKVSNEAEIPLFVKTLLQDPYFHKATHNSSAYRIATPEWAIIESLDDDGETGAGMCILREMRRANAVDMIIIVTRYFGGVHLQTDRFRHVIDATKKMLEKIGETKI
jgi:putative IMPACT (imprinted ancient) family translation regulator